MKPQDRAIRRLQLTIKELNEALLLVWPASWHHHLEVKIRTNVRGWARRRAGQKNALSYRWAAAKLWRNEGRSIHEVTTSGLWAIISRFKKDPQGPFRIINVKTKQQKGTTLAKVARNLEKDRQALGEVAKCALKRLEWAIQQRFDVPEDNILIAILLDPRTFLSAQTILGEKLATKANTLLSEAIENAVLAQVRFEDETSCTEDTGDSITSSRREQAVTTNVIGLHPLLFANMVSHSIATGTSSRRRGNRSYVNERVPRILQKKWKKWTVVSMPLNTCGTEVRMKTSSRKINLWVNFIHTLTSRSGQWRSRIADMRTTMCSSTSCRCISVQSRQAPSSRQCFQRQVKCGTKLIRT